MLPTEHRIRAASRLRWDIFSRAKSRSKARGYTEPFRAPCVCRIGHRGARARGYRANTKRCSTARSNMCVAPPAFRLDLFGKSWWQTCKLASRDYKKGLSLLGATPTAECTQVRWLLTVRPVSCVRVTHGLRMGVPQALLRAVCAYHFWECQSDRLGEVYNNVCRLVCSCVRASV